MRSPIDGLVVDEGEATTLDGLAPVATFSHDRVYRYSLSRRWWHGRVAAFIMLNPSTADATADDPTIRRCIHFAKREGCGALLVVNLFAYRATDPQAMRRADDPVGPANDVVLRQLLEPGAGPAVAPVVAAWGTHGSFTTRAQVVTDRLLQAGVQLHCLGVTSTGQPRHPLYVHGDTPLQPYPVPGAGA